MIMTALLYLTILLPYFIRNILVSGGLEGYSSLFMFKNPYALQLGQISFFDISSRILSNFTNYIYNIIPSVILFPVFQGISVTGLNKLKIVSYAEIIFGLTIFSIFFLGYFIRLIRKMDIIEMYVLAYFIILLTNIWIYPRYLVPIIPMIYYYFITGLKILIKRIKVGGNIKNNFFLFIIIFMISLNLISSIIFVINDKYNEPESFRDYYEAGEWIKNNTPINSVVIARKPYTLYFYDNRKTMGYPFTNEYIQLIDFIKKKKADYLVIDSFSEETKKYLKPLIELERERFILEYQTKDSKTSVYKINK